MPPRRLPQRLLIRLRRILRNDQLVLAGVAIVGGVQFLVLGSFV